MALDSRNATLHPGFAAPSNAAHERRGTFAGKAFEVPYHMHLIVISELVRNLRPEALWRDRFRPERCIESDDARVLFGWETDLLGKPSLELPDAQSGARRPIADAKRCGVPEYPVCDRGDDVDQVRFPPALQQEVIGDLDSSLKARC